MIQSLRKPARHVSIDVQQRFLWAVLYAHAQLRPRLFSTSLHFRGLPKRSEISACGKSRYCFKERIMRVREPARFLQKVRPIDVQEKKKKMENSRVCRLLASGTIGVFYACL